MIVKVQLSLAHSQPKQQVLPLLRRHARARRAGQGDTMTNLRKFLVHNSACPDGVAALAKEPTR